MSAATPEPPTLLLPAEAAKRLRCSEWWLKERARRGDIPYTFVGGAYKFTEEHLTEIIRIFQRTPSDSTTTPVAAIPQQQREPRAATTPVTQLKARLPKRARVMDQKLAA